MFPLRTWVPCLFVALCGCGSGSNAPVSAPSYDPQGMAEAALKDYDKNSNSSIEGLELDACPGLKVGLAAFDSNNDKKITKEELTKRFQFYKDGSAGAVAFNINVTLDGSPLPDAVVTLTPEPFMKGSVKEATGRTGADGSVRSYQFDGSDMPGLPQGVYRISVAKDGVTLPTRYNVQSTLGCEVSGGGRGGNSSIDLKLSGR